MYVRLCGVIGFRDTFTIHVYSFGEGDEKQHIWMSADAVSSAASLFAKMGIGLSLTVGIVLLGLPALFTWVYDLAEIGGFVWYLLWIARVVFDIAVVGFMLRHANYDERTDFNHPNVFFWEILSWCVSVCRIAATAYYIVNDNERDIWTWFEYHCYECIAFMIYVGIFTYILQWWMCTRFQTRVRRSLLPLGERYRLDAFARHVYVIVAFCKKIVIVCCWYALARSRVPLWYLCLIMSAQLAHLVWCWIRIAKSVFLEQAPYGRTVANVDITTCEICCEDGKHLARMTCCTLVLCTDCMEGMLRAGHITGTCLRCPQCRRDVKRNKVHTTGQYGLQVKILLFPV